MFSLENFYYILYTNLFKPARVRTHYFYPFGSVDPQDLIHLSTNKSAPEEKHHNILYDQEPLLKENVDKLISYGIIDDYVFKYAQILGNSEISEYKTHLCIEQNYLDFYYFFHGFAALIWYRDYKYFSENYQFTQKFMSLNHLTQNDRSYRLFLVSKMIEAGITSQGTISLHLDHSKLLEELNSSQSKLSNYAKKHISKYLTSVTLPLIADTSSPTGALSAAAGVDEHLFHQSAFWHVISETVFYYPKLHLTEKIFRPIVNKRPFLLVGAPGNLEYLKRYGFKTFDRWIDESYDQEHDNDIRIEKITVVLKQLCSLSMQELRNMQKEMEEVLEFNFQHFYGEFKHIITEELLTSFKSCVGQWNNGRLDRTIDLTEIDFNKLKTLLLS